MLLRYFLFFTERFSPFILLTLNDVLDGIEGTVFHSLLELNCHKNSGVDASAVSLDADKLSGLHSNPHTLSMADSVRLIRGTGLDSQLLSMLGLDDTELSLNLDHDHVVDGTIQKQTVIIQLPADGQNGTMLEFEPVRMTAVEVQPEPDQMEPVSEVPPQVSAFTFSLLQKDEKTSKLR